MSGDILCAILCAVLATVVVDTIAPAAADKDDNNSRDTALGAVFILVGVLVFWRLT